MPKDLLTVLAPMLTHRPQRRFNVFDVMHHGTHEKQLSNVFAWLLRADATHGLGDAFQRIFIAEVNRGLVKDDRELIADQPFGVRQEVNTAPAGKPMDIADLVLDGDDTTIVIENYGVPDGHEHSYHGYLAYGAIQGPQNSVVVLLCENDFGGNLIEGWENAPVVLYATLLDRVYAHIQELPKYRSEYVEQYYFIENMHRHFTNRTALTMDRAGLIEFVDALCRGGEAERFGQQRQDAVARQLADQLREEAIQRYTEGRELLGEAKQVLRAYCDATLSQQVNETLGHVLGKARTPWSGVHAWSVSIAPHPDFADKAESTYVVHLVLGPSAWHAVNRGRWQNSEVQPDFTRVLLLDDRTGGSVVPSGVSIVEVLEGLDADDRRLHDDLVSLLQR